MTRINVGIEPRELCDQHLVAEYRELPRLWRYLDDPPFGRAPETFKLGAGHVLWCATHLGEMASRFNDLAAEMRRRGFEARWTAAPFDALLHPTATPAEREAARPIVRERIRERVATMRRAPRWTLTQPPPWLD